MDREAHQRVAISRRKVSALEQLFNGEAMKLRRHFSATTKHSRYPHLLQRHFFAQRFQQLGSGEQATNVLVSTKQREPLFDDVLLVLFGHLWLAQL